MNWKRLLLMAAMAGVFAFVGTPRSEAHGYVSVGIGLGFPVGYGYYGYAPYAYGPYYYGYPAYYSVGYGGYYGSRYYYHRHHRYYHHRVYHRYGR